MTATASIRDRILSLVQTILARNAKPVVATPDARLGEIGLTSMDMVNLMLEVEAEFDVTIAQGDLTPENFQSVATIERLVAKLSGYAQGAQAA